MSEPAPASGQPRDGTNHPTGPKDEWPLPAKRQWWLAGLAWLLSLAAFFVPQHIPLEWYPLNEPGTDIHYVEIKCASNADGWVTIWYDITHGWSDIDQIRFPISPTEQTYTYTFPLPDAPMIGLRLDSVAKGGTLTVHHMRIINRRGEEIHAFAIEDLVPVQGIAAIKSLPPGWTITSNDAEVTPTVTVDRFPLLKPVGMSGRNLHRCLLSTGYLAGMLVILMLAVTSAFWRPRGWMDFVGHLALLAVIAVPFSAVGNRGLIRNSIHYAAYVPVAPPPHPTLEITVETDRPAEAQLYWDVGNGFAEPLSMRRSYVRPNEPQILRFPLPEKPLRTLRLDPDDRACTMRILHMAVTDGRGGPETVIPHLGFVPDNNIASLSVEGGVLKIETVPGRDDPYLGFGPDAVSAINAAAAAIQAPASPADSP